MRWPLLLLFACVACETAPKQAPAPSARPAPRVHGLRDCTHAAAPDALKGPKWQHARSGAIAAVGSPRHVARDRVVVQGSRAVLEAKFQYGRLFKDLEDEPVEVFLDRCGAKAERLRRVKTDGDGWATLELPSHAPGVYEITWRVLGDATTVSSRLWVVGTDTRLAVFDIDGTLTTSDTQTMRASFEDIFLGRETPYTPKLYPGAIDLVDAYTHHGVVPVYLSGRPYWLGPHTRAWMRQAGVPEGPVLLTRHHREVLPMEQAVSVFKRRALEELMTAGLHIVAAHGNAHTDVYAYTQAHPKISGPLYIIGEHGGRGGTAAIKGSWTDLAARVRQHGPGAKP